MVILLLLVVLAIAVPVVVGFVKSRELRRIDRRHFVEFLGFTAGLLAIIATVAYFTAALIWFRPPVVPYYHPTRQGIIFICGSIGMISSLAAFLAGFFGRGIRRVMLIIFGPLMALIYVLGAFSNFGA